MNLLQWIEQALEKIAPNVAHIAGTIANMASVLASISWLISQALSFVKTR